MKLDASNCISEHSMVLSQTSNCKKQMKYNHMPVYVRIIALLLLMAGGFSQLSAQTSETKTYYTLTNGRLWWSNGLENQSDDDWKDPVAFDASRQDAYGNLLEVHPHGTTHVTQITVQGDTYLALDITDPEHPQIVARNNHQFNLYCVWERTGTTGYYFQEWPSTDGKTYRYYLIGTENGLTVTRSEVGKPLEQSSYWYDWDFGAAVWEKPIIDGAAKNCYYWIMLQTTNRANCNSQDPVWTMSRHSYQRPEDIQYTTYNATADDATATPEEREAARAQNTANIRYFDDINCGGLTHMPAGNGALFMPVKVTIYEKNILHVNNDNEGHPYGLQRTVDASNRTLGTGLTITDNNGDPVTEFTYNLDGSASVNLEAQVIFVQDGVNMKVPMEVMPGYTRYQEETKRRGIHRNYGMRTDDLFGAAGVPTYAIHNYWGGENHHEMTPSSIEEEALISSVTFSVDNRSRRYLNVEAVAGYPLKSKLNFYSPVMGEHNAEIYVTVRYDNGVVQRDTVQLKLKFQKPAANVTPTNGPVVRGAVFGGGRMANVGGGTEIIVHSADSISAVYGGNDIAGWVQGDQGANIKLGTEFTGKGKAGDNNIHPVHIGAVYGGGNGYYTYQGINAGYNEADQTRVNPYYQQQSTSLIYSAYYFNGYVYPWNTLPAGYLTGDAANADLMNKDRNAWAGLEPVVDHEFNYTPFYIGRPDLVDQEEKGNDGDGTIPYIKTAHITVGVPEGKDNSGNLTFFVDAEGDSTHWHNDHILIDTLFGGARNAFIGVTSNDANHPENGVTIDIHGGTIFSVFGGNNVGGSVANTSTVYVNVHDTKLLAPNEPLVEDTWLNGFGRDFGIRYLYGGGNLVEGSNSNVTISGGMLDTVYLGGNQASVKQPFGLVECLRNPANGLQAVNTGYGHFGYNGHFICTNPTYPTSLDYTDPVAALRTDASFFDGFGPGQLEPENGHYNIRCLFGGNNAADMSNQTIIQLHSGGISSVYGGGNVGDMTNESLYHVDGTLTVPPSLMPAIGALNGTKAGCSPTSGEDQLFPNPLYNFLIKQAFDIELNPLTGEESAYTEGGWADVYGRATIPNAVGTIVTALPDSKIVCDYVFGGSRMGNVTASCGVWLAGGIYGYVNGGNDISGDIGSETGGGTYLVLNHNALVVGDAMAGSDGFYHCEDPARPHHYDGSELYDTYTDQGEPISYDPYDDYAGMLMPTHNNTNFYMRGGVVLGQVYGGGVHADVGFGERNGNRILKYNPTTKKREERDINLFSGEKNGSIHFMASHGRILSNGFGGGYQSNTNGLAYLTLRNDIQIDGSFYSGNDCTGNIQGFGAYWNPNDSEEYKRNNPGATDEQALVYAYEQMTATGNMSTVDTDPAIMLNQDNGDGTWSAIYKTYLRINDTPRIKCVYGSGNGTYNYNGKKPEYEDVSYCDNGTGTLSPEQSSTFIDIHISGHHPDYLTKTNIDTVFGGGNGVGVEEDVVVFLNSTGSDVHGVHTIFGGNNRDDMMNVVPNIWLKQGIVNTVFGGSNNGRMGAGPQGRKGTIVTDVNGNQLTNISTHVVLESDKVTVLDTVFGGNRLSDVLGNTYVEVRNTTDDGVNYVFGGNDISGNITGVSRVDVSGGTVKNLFGGSNGYYDYVEIGDSLFRIYPYGSVTDNPADSANKCIAIAARPDIDSTNLNLWGGNIGAGVDGVYGGGSMADCRTTEVVVNNLAEGNERELNIYGTLFGGGMGKYDNLNARNLQGSRYGNVTENTHLDLYHTTSVQHAKAYGGGRGGDVMNTYITIHEGWNTPFDELYGGCWGSDVFGTTHLDFSGIYLVQNLFGGNDFAGDVYRTDITVHSGLFYNVYGAGNGVYPDASYNTGIYASKPIHRPNTEYVNITFDDGTVEGNLYGGGKMGTTWAYKKDPVSHVYLLDANGNKQPDILLDAAYAHINPEDYSYVITNIHGGLFENNVFGGASGRDGSSTDALVYGLKVINMDGGEIRMSLYGGSESVSDGYASECVDKDNTTKRPSSIINLTGGTVESNLYGAGYLGTTYGSVYVNIGTDAIDSCVAYSAKYATNSIEGTPADSLYKKFKPGVKNSLSPALAENTLVLNHSVYAGANWGAGSGSAVFSTPGFAGGESMIRIDGKDYNTTTNELSALPQMNIKKSLFGSGTSVKGGDVRSHIDLWNYGVLEECHASKELESVQRADQFFSHNTSVHYLGATDGTSAYISEPYTLLRLGSVDFRGYNVAEYEAAINYVEGMRFYEEDLNATTHDLVLVPVQELRDVQPTGTACGASATICAKTSVVSPSDVDKQHTLLIFNNGIDVSIQNELGTTGPVAGFGYVTTPWGYSSSIVGQPTVHMDGSSLVSNLAPSSTTTTDGDWINGYAGFASPCDTSNQYTADRGRVPSVTWINSEDGSWNTNRSNAEFPYTNFVDNSDSYREWKVGTGIRLRETAILAHTDPTNLPEDVNIKVNLPNSQGNNQELALAKASITLPATSEGHYYKLNSQGIIISGSNSSVNLVDQTWYTTHDFDELGTDYTNGNNVSTKGEWKSATMEENGIPIGANQILNYPDNTFGLILVPGNNFKNTMPNVTYDHDHDSNTPEVPVPYDWSNLILSGNSYYNAAANYCSPQVSEGDRIMPTMDFLMTYSPNFATTFLGTVEFTLDEYDADGNPVGPVKVKAYLSTIIETFRDMQTSVLAMFNNGATDEFTRRVILPITLDENRELYITSVQWEPVHGDGSSYPVNNDENKFYLTDNNNTIKDASFDPLVNNLFGIQIVPNDAVTGDLNENLGWTSIDNTNINIYSLAPASGNPAKYAGSNNANTVVDLTNSGSTNGLRLGILDGRGTAALNVTLNYDGRRVYPDNGDNGYLGKVKLGMKWKKGENSGIFDFTIYVKTRDHGDTIYLASADSVRRPRGGNGGFYTVRPYWHDQSYYQILMNTSQSTQGYQDSIDKAPKVIGKSPNCYVQSFQHALSSNVYQEGDVIAIIDKVNIDERPVHIQGADGPPIQVIRYEGHHHELPSDTGGVYRGPMIEVSGTGVFTAQNIDFHGSAGARVKRVLRNGSGAPILDGNDKLQFVTSFTFEHPETHATTTYTKPDGAKDLKIPDTNEVFAPIIVVKNGGEVTLSEGTLVRHNWNEYGSEESQRAVNGMPLNPEMMGAISVTGGGTLTLKGNVSIRDNFGHTFASHDDVTPVSVAYAPGNGAIYVDGGYVVLSASNQNTAVDITRNRLMVPAVHSSATSWWNIALINGVPSRYTLDESTVENWKKANVLLTRTNPNSGNPILQDGKSDVIQVAGILGNNTKIGVRKWFPGPTSRDTIRFAVNTGADFTILNKVYKNNNFESDDEFFVFYSPDVNTLTEYLLRCATFRHQKWNVNLPIADVNGDPIMGEDVLYYGPLVSNTCPTGGDSIVYRVQGGFAPYTYTWEVKHGTEWDLMRKYVTPYSNIVVSNAVEAQNNDLYLASVVDTLLTPSIDMPHNESQRVINVRVKADDITGFCPISKDMQITVHKVHDLAGHAHWEPEISPNGWSDTASRDSASRVTAVGDRYYKSIVITPYVSYDPASGNIIATRDGELDYIYQYIDDANHHELSDQLFCEGDIIHLMTQPTIEDAEFIMWSFDPFNNNPATYVVPNHDDDVIAYYNAQYYWHQKVNTPVLGGAANAEDYDYALSNSPLQTVPAYKRYSGKQEIENYTKAGYITTYSGDVHIYNENGLAWFISVVNGLNGYQSRPFQFNTVYLHQKQKVDANGDFVFETDGTTPVIEPYDMQRFLWTPVGTRQYGFRGRLYGVGVGIHDTVAITTDPEQRVVIQNIMVNEPNMSYVGFFGTLDGATCVGITLRDIFVRGGQYVGGLVAQADNTTIQNCAVDGSGVKNSIITTNYVSGGIVADSYNSDIDVVKVKASFTGNAVYSGGVSGVGEGNVITNPEVHVVSYASGLYVGTSVGSEAGGETETSCLVDNIYAAATPTTVTTETSDGGPVTQSAYIVHVEWQAPNATTVEVGYCEGSDWYEPAGTTSTWTTASGSSQDLTIIPSPNADNNIYTIAVRIRCSESDDEWSMATTSIALSNSDVPEVCPEYEIQARLNVEDRALEVHWWPTQGDVNLDNTTVQVGYCAGTVWNTAAAMRNYPASQGGTDAGVQFTFPATTAMDSVYTVALYSPCNQQYYYYTIALCPNYQVSAGYIGPSDNEPNVQPSVTMYWYNTTPNTMYEGTTVKVAINYGTSLATDVQWITLGSGNYSTDNDGICSYTFTSLPELPQGVTTYTVALQSLCNGSVKTAQVTVRNVETTCPEYQITEAYYEQQQVQADYIPVITVKWRNTNSVTEDNVLIGVCRGSSWDNGDTYPVSATNNIDATNGECSYSFDVTNLPLRADDNNTYTVMLMSQTCTTSVVTRTVSLSGTSATCPTYQVSASIANSTVVMSWTTSGPSETVMLGICAGSTWQGQFSEQASSIDPTSPAAGSSYTFAQTQLPELPQGVTTYTVALRSDCDVNNPTVYTATVNVASGHSGILGTFGPEADVTLLQQRPARKTGSTRRSVIANGYFHITTNGRTQRIGGIAGRASNTDILNNYVYGSVGSGIRSGSVVAIVENGSKVSGNYSAHGTASRNIGQQQGGMVSNGAGFEGQGNHVTLDRSIDGIENLTLALNRWVRQQNENGGRYRTWRNDLDGTVNNGYPYFGQPDMTPVNANLFVEGCDWAVYDGLVYTHDTVLTSRVIDYDMMVDSTITTTIRLHGTTHTILDDSVMTGLDYEGYGFYISADELNMLYLTMGDEGRASIILTDTLTSEFGCDSIVSLTLTFRTSSTDIPEVEETPTTVNVYPNPTTSVVYVESEDMTHVEVYDNEGRRLQDYKAYGSNKVTVDMTPYVTGVYFVRVHSPHGVTIQKVIKER